MRRLLIAFVTVAVLFAAVAPATVAGATPAAAAQTQTEEPTCEYPLEVEDATGETITIEEEPDAVVALQPSDAQTLFEIGAEDTVVGMPVGPYTDYLEADEELDISEDDGVTPVAEEVIDREPDVVLAANALENDDVIEQLRDAGLTVYVYPTGESLDGVAENVRLTGEIVGECEGAQDTLDWMDERLEIVNETLDGEDRPLAYYAMGGGYTAGNGTFQHEILTTAGVDNLGAEADIEGWGEISEEEVVAEDPEWIVYGDSFDEPPVGDAVTETTAYENEQFVAVDDNYMSQPGPLVVLAIEEIAQEVHPDAYAEAESELEENATDDESADDGADADDETATESNGSDDGDDGDDEAADDEAASEADGDDSGGETEESIPGFGVPAAVAAALVAAAFLTRRQ